MTNKFKQGLDKNPANYQPLTPLALLDRAADIHPDRIAVIHGERRFTWAAYAQRCRSLAPVSYTHLTLPTSDLV